MSTTDNCQNNPSGIIFEHSRAQNSYFWLLSLNFEGEHLKLATKFQRKPPRT